MEVKKLWSFVDCKRKMRLREMPVRLLFRSDVLLTNIHNSVCPNMIAQLLDCTPSSLEEYLALHRNVEE